jgi:uncharacterized membrane protein YdbT with pleckstrin-like domain
MFPYIASVFALFAAGALFISFWPWSLLGVIAVLLFLAGVLGGFLYIAELILRQ